MKSDAVISEYIRTFVKNFVFANKQERVRLNLLPLCDANWPKVSQKLATYLDFKTCTKLSSLEKSLESLQAKFGNKSGIYMDFSSPPKSVTVLEAGSIHFGDALLILNEGNVVFFFTRDDDVYLCTKKPS